jgi:hypothetical protein
MSNKNYLIIFGVLIAIGILIAGAVLLFWVARNYLAGPTPTQPGPEVAYTSVAQTVEAQLTQVAIATELVAPTQTPVPVLPTATPLPTSTPLPPTATQVPPTVTPIPIPCDRATFVEDVSYPDNTEVTGGTTFIKTWRLRNNGSCTWNSSYSLVFDHGDSMGGAASAQLTTGIVAPGQLIDVSVTLKAPSTPGTYQGYWKLRNGAGVIFGIGADAQSPFWVKIKATNPVTPTPAANVTFDFITKGASAEWHNATDLLSWGDPDNDDPGVAVNLDNVKLEDNKTYSRALATYPQKINNGIIYGIYPSYTVQTNDHLRALLGLRNDCTNGKVKFVIKYKEGTTETVLGEWLKSCDGSLLSIDKDLSSLNGKALSFILYVSTEGSYESDKSVWVYPRIER